MTRPTALLALLALLVPAALTGCSDEESDRQADRGAVSSTSGDPTGGSTTETAPAEPATATFGFGGGPPGEDYAGGTAAIELGCEAADDFIVYEQLTVDTAVTLSRLGSDTLEVGRAWVSDDREQRTSSGFLDPDAPGSSVTDEPGWASRERLAGAEMVPGTTYTVFFELAVPPGARQRELTIDYELDDTAGSATWPYAIDRVRRCRPSGS